MVSVVRARATVLSRETPCAASLEIAEQIRRVLSEEQPRRPWIERRSSRRYAYPHLIVVTPLDGHLQPASSSLVSCGKEISLSGIGFYMPQPFPFSKAVITFPCDSLFHSSISILTELRWCRFTRLGWYENGGRFVRLFELPQGSLENGDLECVAKH